MLLVKISLACGLFCLASGAEIISYPRPTPYLPPCGYCPPRKVCKNGKCVCRKDHDHRGKCVVCPPPRIYKRCPTNCPRTCEDDPDVPISCSKECNLNRYCICPPGYVEKSKTDNTCVKKERCPKNCPGGCPPNSRCVYGKCICTRRCPPNEHCVDGKCVCLPGYFLNEGRCIDKCPKPKVFNSCPNICTLSCDYPIPRQCKGKCRPGVQCVCPKGWLERNDEDSQCVRPSQCKNYDPCSLIRCGSHSHCEDGECLCNDGYTKDRSGKCVDKCIYMKCGEPYQTCKEGKCICIDAIDGYMMVKGNCVPNCPRPTIYNSCPTACPVNCDNKDNPPKICIDICRPRVKCVCRKGYIERSATNFDCVKPSQCPDDCRRCPKHSTCNRKRKCVCNEGYMMNDGKCFDACIATLCPIGRICKLGKCLCPDGSKPIDGKCPAKCPPPKIFKPCPNVCTVNCENKDDPPMCPAVCRPGGRCACPNGYIERSPTNSDCVKPSQCPDDCRRCPKHSTCNRKGKCVCKEGYIMNDGKCADACIVTKCTAGRICKLGRCLCPDGSEEIGGECNHLCAVIYCGYGKTCRNGRCVNLCDGNVCKPNQRCDYGRCVG